MEKMQNKSSWIYLPALFIIFITFTGNLCLAQQKINICTDTALHGAGLVRIMADTELLDDIKPAVIQGDIPTMPGYRIQVYTGNDRSEAQKLKNEIASEYNVSTYVVYESPYFKVRVGDYRTRIEAQQMFHTLKQAYSGILLVPGDIQWPDLKQ